MATTTTTVYVPWNAIGTSSENCPRTSAVNEKPERSAACVVTPAKLARIT